MIIMKNTGYRLLLGVLMLAGTLAVGGCASTAEPMPAPAEATRASAADLACPAGKCLHGIKINNQCTYVCGTCPPVSC